MEGGKEAAPSSGPVALTLGFVAGKDRYLGVDAVEDHVVQGPNEPGLFNGGEKGVVAGQFRISFRHFVWFTPEIRHFGLITTVPGGCAGTTPADVPVEVLRSGVSQADN